MTSGAAGSGSGRFGFDPASVFDAVADDYEANRPTYPDSLYDAIEAIVGPLVGRLVADVGAGTGISTRALAARGARVVAVDPSLAMARTLRAGSGSVPTTLGQAEHLPLRTGSVDLVTFAQAWHWVQIPAAPVESRRVLGPSGRLVLWWNVSEDADELYDALWAECELERYGGRTRQDDTESLLARGGFSLLVKDVVRWQWRVPVEHWLATVQTRSAMAKRGPAAREQTGAIEAVVRRYFPDGVVSEWFSTRLTVAVP